MKEQEQKNLNTQEPKQQTSEDKVKTQNPKNKVIIWSAAGAAAAALSSVVSFTTVFSNQRKVSFLDKVLQSIKIDVKDKETKTKDDIKTIADFEASNLDSKLYELIVETEENQVNKQPLDKDKPYTTFRTKFAIRNKFTKVQSNYRAFEFRDIKPPKEKAELDKLGKISEKEEDRVNDKVKIEFVNFNRGQHLASAVATRDENGKFKYFNIYLKQDNDDTLQYEIVNVGVETNDDEAKAIFSYQLKVKSIDDEKFVSDKLSIEFKDFAIPSTRLTDYLKGLTINYKDVASTYIQDANREGIVQGTTLSNPNYNLEFENFEKLETENKVKAKVKIVDKSTKESSEAVEIEISNFFDYKKIVDETTKNITFDYTDKENSFANQLKKQNLKSNLVLLSNSDKLEVVYQGNELVQGDENDVNARKTAIVSFKIKDKRTQYESELKTFTIDGFKEYQIKSELDAYLNNITLDANNKASTYIDDVTSSQITKTNFDETKYKIDTDTFVIEKLSNLTSIKVHFRITENNSQNIYSNQKTVEINDFKIPKRLLNELIQKIELDVTGKATKMAYDFWDNFGAIDIKRNVDNRVEFNGTPSVKQTAANELTVRFKIHDKKNHDIVSDEREIKIKDFKTNTVNSASFGYYLYDYNGHQVACLNKKKVETVFKVPNTVDSFKVKKAMNLYAYENYTRDYCISVAEGIEEVENLIYTSANATSDLLALSLPKTLKVAKNVIVGPTKKLLYLEMPSSVQQVEGLYESSNIELDENDVFNNFYYYFGASEFHGKSLTPNDKRDWKGGFRVKLVDTQNPANYEIKQNFDSKYNFLVRKDSNYLVKLIEKKNTPKQLDLNLNSHNFKGIVQGAFYGTSTTKLTLRSDTIENVENLFSSSNSALTELDLSGLTKFKHFNNLGPSYNNIKKVKLPDNMGEHISFSFRGWKDLEEVELPIFTKIISSSMFYECEKLNKVNFEKLVNLEQIVDKKDIDNNSNEALNYLHFISSKTMAEIDLSKTKLKKLASAVFPYMDKLEKIILPETLLKVGHTISYRTYEDHNSSNISEHKIGFLNKLLTIQIKKLDRKPAEWSDYWIGQYWNSTNQNGANPSEVKIEWKQN
ncbi:leucine-rich repeat protein [Metamycoplasma hyosynoviae]|uniref:leucine-rich repeat protein n=1 Tax=Metamycoplasma hyosynoviae TaxID=29559 RepID=UPI0023587033|nr:leucine-rich repeat protein [Metamycoplasma hyosynoviae]MDC8916067.1 leucine-rich repeat protein [Metamycoplasma hyosynoviae]